MNPRVAVLVGLGLFAVFAVRTYRAKRRVVGTPDSKGWTVPVLQAGEDEALPLEAVTERKEGARRIRLIAPGGGEAVFILKDPMPGGSGDFAFGKAVLEPAADRERGAKLVAAVARWLRQPVPPAGRAGELVPFRMTYVRLGVRDGWEANKLFFERGQENPEVYLNLSADGRRARLLEKDEAYREPLLATLAFILRDGQPPRRTPETDPLIASAEPLFGDFHPLAGGEGLRQISSHPDGFLAVREVPRDGRRGCELWRWTHPGQAPARVAALEGVIGGLTVAPDGRHVGVNLVRPKNKTTLSSDDPGVVGVLDLRTGKMATLLESGSAAFGFSGVFSPDSARFALAHEKITRVHDLVTGREVARTDPALGLSPLRWEGEELVLHHFDYDRATDRETTTYHRWRPGHGSPRSVATPPLPVPGGRYRLEATLKGIVIHGPSGKRELAISPPQDRETVATLFELDDPAWLGPGDLVLRLAEEPLALNLATGKMRYLFHGADIRFKAASGDGKWVVVEDEVRGTMWAERR